MLIGMKWYDSVKVKLLGFFIMISAVFLISIVVTFLIIRENNLKDNATKESTLATAQVLEHIKTTQTKAEEIVLALASIAKNEFDRHTYDDGFITSLLSTNRKNGVTIVSGGVWFEPNVIDENIKDFILFYNKTDQNKFEKVKNYNAEFRNMEFYALSKKTKKGDVIWTEVYNDPVTKVHMITVASPIYKKNQFIGTASIDIKIGDTDQKFWDIQEAKNMYMMMIDKSGNFIGMSKSLKKYIHSRNIYTQNDPQIKSMIDKIQPMLKHNIEHEHDERNMFNKIFFIKNDPIIHQKSILAVYHFANTHWNIIIGIPEDIVMAQSNRIYKKVLVLIIILTLLATISGYIILDKLFVKPMEAINAQLNPDLNGKNQHYTLLQCEDKGEIGTLVDNLNARTVALSETQAREADEIAKRLQNEKMLLQQSKMAAMGEMMDAVAHQWKQPLNALSMYAEIIKGDYEDGNIDQAYIDQFRNDIQMQIDHMVNTLDEFRTFFKPNKEDENFQLLAVINSVLILTKDDLLKNRITVSIDQSDPIFMDGSANEFKHLVLNILNNAKDAFNDNNIEKRKISIRLIKDAQGKRLEIEDNAGGIPDEIIDDIFKAHITTKEEGKGTGIGLYMSTQIATKHNAVLSVKNHNDGACFTVAFKD